jgi:uncharacterized protein involved in response to NO
MNTELRRVIPLKAETAHEVRRASIEALMAAPHRPAFLAGMLMLIVVSAWWAFLLATPYAGAAVSTSMPPMLVHGFTFAAGFMPLFMTGFLFTAGPRWLDVPAPPARALQWPVLLHVTGVLLLVVGAVVESDVTAFGALLLAMAWTTVGVGFAGLIRASRARDKLHAKCVLVFWIIGIGCAMLFAAGLAILQMQVVAAALWLMVFGFITPIYATVAHRLLPFFTSTVVTRFVPWKPNWALGLLLASLLAFGGLQTAARIDLLAPRQAAWLTVTTVGPAALALAVLAVRWGLLQSLRGRSLRLLAMLHLGFVWSVIALALAVLDATAALLGDSEPVVRLGLAPLHALTMGFLGGLLFAMATRVIRGHGGVPVVADDFVWSLFWMLQAATLLRLGATLWPAHSSAISASAAVAWLVVWIAWAGRHLPILVRPRPDGRAG